MWMMKIVVLMLILMILEDSQSYGSVYEWFLKEGSRELNYAPDNTAVLTLKLGNQIQLHSTDIHSIFQTLLKKIPIPKHFKSNCCCYCYRFC